MTYKPDRNYRGVERLTLADFQAIHTALVEARSGLVDAQYALRNFDHDLNRQDHFLKKKGIRLLLNELDAKECALDKATRSDVGIEIEIGVLSLMHETPVEPTYARVDVEASIRSRAIRLGLFADTKNPKARAASFAASVLKSLDATEPSPEDLEQLARE